MPDGDSDAEGLDAGDGEPSDDEADSGPNPTQSENTTPPAVAPENGNGETDETVPAVELDLYELSVRVSGQSTDSLDDVESTARSLMDYLVEHANHLEDRPDDRGLS